MGFFNLKHIATNFGLILLFLFSSCNKDNRGDCFNSNGKNSSISSELTDFSKINIDGNFDVIITPNTSNSIVIEGGKNLIPNVFFEVKNDELIIKSNNNCGIFRDNSKRITIKLSLDSINEIEQSVSGNISFTDTIYSQNFTWNVWQSIGNIHAKIKSKSLKTFIHTGAVDFKIEGLSDFALFYCSGVSFVKANNFIVKDLEVNILSKGTTSIFPIDKLNVISNNSGDIILYNNPNEIIYSLITNPSVIKFK